MSDCISREQAIKSAKCIIESNSVMKAFCILRMLKELPSVTAERTGHCKDCKYFEYDSVAKVDGIPLIVAHEICSRWGDGCKTREDGYCFLFESQERSENECR